MKRHYFNLMVLFFVHSEKEYINVIFNTKQELEHGKRYLVCAHAPRTEIKYEKWTEVLDEVKTCSDGVTVDLTPPTPGHVWIGIDLTEQYQVNIRIVDTS